MKLQIQKTLTSKRCSKCREPKELSAFSKHKNRKDGLQPYCKLCQTSISKAHYESHKDVRKAGMKALYEANRERRLSAAKALGNAWRKANRERYQYLERRRHFRLSYGPHIEFKDDPLMQTKNRYREANKLGYRSGLEVRIVRELEEQRFTLGEDFTYESHTIRYNQPADIRRYTPDLILKNGIVIELKGQWVTADRKKITLVKTQFPDLDLRMVFNNADARISKQSKTTYRDICTKLKIPCVSKSIPLAWLQEDPVPARLDALEAACGYTQLQKS